MSVSYNGSAYSGFQGQPDKNTIQDHLELAIFMLTGTEVKIAASGRTDSGVHARGQVFNFHTDSKIPIERWCIAVNSRLPRDILVWDAREVDIRFHARHSAKRKTYRYTIRCGKFVDLFQRSTQFHHHAPLDTDAMNEALAYVVGEHDFSSFCSPKSTKPSHVRTIYEARILLEPLDVHLQSYAMHIEITGNGFLYNMVRIIVGTLLQIGEGKRKASEMKKILEARNRALAGPTAEAFGLTLWEVFYAE